MRLTMMVGAMVLGISGFAWAAATAPATRAMESRAAATQWSWTAMPAPKQALARLLIAVNKGDEAALRATLVMPEEDGKGDVKKTVAETLVKLLAATSKLQTAAERRFGDEGVKAFGTASTEQMHARLKALDAATLAVDAAGTTATVAIPADADLHYASGTVVLRKVGGEWKVDAASLLQLDGAKDTTEFKQRMELAARMVVLTADMTREIEDGKYGTAGEAYEEFMGRCVAALK